MLKADGALRDALSIFDRVVSFSGNQLTRKAVSENLNVLDHDVYFQVSDLLLENNIPQVLITLNNIMTMGFEGHHFIIGLASHFRDLLVSKDPDTVQLLEVGDATKKRYLEQAKKSDIRFLMRAIDLANDCDLSFKSSKNQRLLVELTLMKIASITFDGKKKSKRFIIPSFHFLTTTPPPKYTPKASSVGDVQKQQLAEQPKAAPIKTVERPSEAQPVVSKNIIKPKTLILKRRSPKLCSFFIKFETKQGRGSQF